MSDDRRGPDADDDLGDSVSSAELVARLQRRAARERAARIEAELIAENQLRRSYERSREVELFAAIAVLVNES
ncbi:MAG TPA: hypothetical protein VFL59_12905, partial [Candidatus Nanopelagicales bacterium]|nr:hypothetical protein [Candidatus Nanopelagicales bacterium]